MQTNGRPDGVDLYAVATGTSEELPNYPPSAWLEREGWPVPTLADDEDFSVGRAFGLSGYPYFVVLDADHRVLTRASGEIPVSELERLLDLARGTSSTN